MSTDAQKLGDWGELQVAKHVPCQVCHSKGLTALANSFPSLDLVCRECGAYLAQVKTVSVSVSAPTKRPNVIRGAGWRPLQAQIAIGSIRDLYLVGALPHGKAWQLAWIDRVPGQGLLANAHVFEHRIANIGGGKRLHPMFNIAYAKIPPACVLSVYSG